MFDDFIIFVFYSQVAYQNEIYMKKLFAPNKEDSTIN